MVITMAKICIAHVSSLGQQTCMQNFTSDISFIYKKHNNGWFEQYLLRLHKAFYENKTRPDGNWHENYCSNDFVKQKGFKKIYYIFEKVF